MPPKIKCPKKIKKFQPFKNYKHPFYMILTCLGFITFLYLSEKSRNNNKLKNGTRKKERKKENKKTTPQR